VSRCDDAPEGLLTKNLMFAFQLPDPHPVRHAFQAAPTASQKSEQARCLSDKLLRKVDVSVATTDL
jgi:hypothetical protein